MTNPENDHPDNGSRENSPETASAGADAAEQIQRRFSGHDPAAGTDTGGTPWAGRQLTSTGFDGDTGTADAQLLSLLLSRGQDPDSLDDSRLMSLVTRARLLVPVMAVAGETTEVDGLAADATSDIAAVTLVAPDGQRALPAFTSLNALADWNAEARPVPVTAQRAAQAAVQEGCHVIVLDPGLPTACTLRGSMVWALAMDRDWGPAHHDPQVARAVQAAVASEQHATGASLRGGPHGTLVVELTLPPGLDQQTVRALVQRIGGRVAADGEVRARIDAVRFALQTG